MSALLGIFNRSDLHERLPEEAARARRHDTSLSVVMVDLDHFEAINDTYGQEAGDVALQHCVAVVRSTLRVSDWMARYGGEELVIVLPETHIQGAYAVAERMRRLCAETPVPLPTGDIGVTASFGVASLDGMPASTENADAMLRNAAIALHESQRAGRNKVTCQPRNPAPRAHDP
jgi:diguanylate cyclase (GGDEF)-like protein